MITKNGNRNTKAAKPLLLGLLIAASVIFAYHQDSHAEDLDDIKEQFVAEAGNNIALKQQIQQNKAELEIENAMEIKDSSKIADLEKRISDLEANHLKSMEKLQVIRDKTTKFFEMEPELKAKLQDAKQTIRESHDMIPWNALGINHLEKKLVIQFENEKQVQKYENVIRELVGKDIPIKISVDTNEWNSACSSRTADCSDRIGGLAIDNDATYDTDGCGLGFPVQKGMLSGWITAGHCFLSGSTDVYQPDSTVSNQRIGYIHTRDFQNNGNCDCAFILQTNSDDRSNEIYKDSNQVHAITYKNDADVSDWIAVSLAYTDLVAWGLVEEVDFSFTAGGVTVHGLTKVIYLSYGQNGDSGSPVFDPTIETLYGTYSGKSSTYKVFTPWSAHVNSLGVS